MLIRLLLTVKMLGQLAGVDRALLHNYDSERVVSCPTKANNKFATLHHHAAYQIQIYFN